VFKIRRRLAMWAAIVIGLPALARALHGVAEVIEVRRGTTPVARNLHRAGNMAALLHGNLRGKPRRRASRV
jgi:hypothetical protein